MSDILGVGGTSAFDVTNLDESVRRISAVESTWRLPKLPDEVKFDLAANPELSPDALASFMVGLDRDFNDEDDASFGAQEESEPEPPVLRPVLRNEVNPRSGYDQLKVLASDLTNQPAATEPDIDAVTKFKMEAIERGFLERPADGRVDGTWSPGLNGVLFDMSFDDQNRRMSGEDSIDSMSSNTALDLLAEWTQPGNLLAAAADLDLIWNPSKVLDETTNWMQKWRDVGEASNPFEFGKNLVGAILGPIDEIAMPIINWTLILGTGGLGSSAVAARSGFLAARTFKGAGALRGLASVTAGDTRLALASSTANRLLRAESGAARAVGGAMKSWRELTPVVRTKQALQPGMRLGVVSQAQQMLPGYAGGYNLADIPGVGGVQDQLKDFSKSYWSLPVELLVAPQNIFSRGTFTVGGGNALRSTLDFVGSKRGSASIGAVAGAAYGAATGDDLGDVAAGAGYGAAGALLLPRVGRVLSNPAVATTATGAILGAAGGGLLAMMDDDDSTNPWGNAFAGAAMGVTALHAKSAWFKSPNKNRFVGFVSDVAQKSEWSRITNDQAQTAAMHNALFDRVESYREAHARGDGSFLGTWKEWQGTDDVRTIGAEMMSWMTGYIMHRTASLMAGGEGDEFLHGYHAARTKLLGQIRQVNMDQGLDSLLDGMSRSMAKASAPDGDFFGDRAREIRAQLAAKDPAEVLEMVAHQNRMSRQLMTQLFALENLDGVGEEGARFLRAMRENPAEALDRFGEYMAANIEAVGDWKSYSGHMEELRTFEAAGALNGSTLREIALPYGGSVTDKSAANSLYAKASVDMERAFQDELLAAGVDAATSQWVAPLGHTDPTGVFAWAKKTTVSGTRMKREEYRASAYRGMYDVIDSIRTSIGTPSEIVARLGADPSQMSEAVLKATLRSMGSSGHVEQYDNIQRLIKYAKSADDGKGIGLDQVERHLDEAVKDFLRGGEDNLWVHATGQSTVSRAADGPVSSRVLDVEDAMDRRSMLSVRAKQLNKKARYTASEVDTEAHIADLRARGANDAADELQAAIDSADAAGYHLVHGVDFMVPSDLAKMDKFQDVTRLNNHAMTLGNFFKGRLPAAARANEERRQRGGIAAAMLASGRRVDPEGEEVTGIIADLREILTRMQDEAADSISSLRTQGILQRTGTRVQSMGVPLRTEDMGGISKQGKRVREELVRMGHSEDVANAVWRAVPGFRNAEFKDVGLYAMEASLRERNQLVGALKFASGTGVNGRNLAVGAAVGFYGGAKAGVDHTSADASELETRMKQVGFGLVGAAVAGGIQGVAGKQVAKLIPQAEMMRFGYLADGIARARDTLRFSLSPFFDLSRYTEGYMLGQIAGPLRRADDLMDDAGNVVAKAGDRFALPADMSPTGFRRRLAKSSKVKAAADASGSSTKMVAQGEFDRTLAEFRAAARGDFDPNELDSTGRWFSQVGIMGFNPTDWMATAFGELRVAGFSTEDAYKHARAMYTYGTTGRSAAEMSVNFIVFPFSFQKKAYTHIAKYLTDDQARSWILHDSFKAYDELSDRYNLDEVWKDHLPVLQQLRRLNMFAYGLSAGQMGGMNARLIEPVYKAGSELSAQLFGPAGFSIRDAASAAEVTELHRKLIPAINDIDWMINNMHEQANVVLGPSGLTKRAEAREGWDKWTEFKDEMSQSLDAQGLSWQDAYREPLLGDVKQLIEGKRAELAAKYPQWREQQINGIGNSASKEMERKDRVAAATSNLETATTSDFQMKSMEDLLDYLQQQLKVQGIDVGGQASWVDAPPEVFYRVRETALGMLAENPQFASIWGKFYEPFFGILESKI